LTKYSLEFVRTKYNQDSKDSLLYIERSVSKPKSLSGAVMDASGSEDSFIREFNQWFTKGGTESE